MREPFRLANQNSQVVLKSNNETNKSVVKVHQFVFYFIVIRVSLRNNHKNQLFDLSDKKERNAGRRALRYLLLSFISRHNTNAHSVFIKEFFAFGCRFDSVVCGKKKKCFFFLPLNRLLGSIVYQLSTRGSDRFYVFYVNK